MSKRQKVQETVFYGGKYDEWPPEDPVGFMAWFQARIDRIPPEHMANATICFDTQSEYYGSSSVCLEITYMRDETDDQYAARLQREEAAKQFAIAREKAMLASLLAKHGVP